MVLTIFNLRSLYAIIRYAAAGNVSKSAPMLRQRGWRLDNADPVKTLAASYQWRHRSRDRALDL